MVCYLPPLNHFNFNPKDLQDLFNQLPSPFILMGDFNGHHTLWGCEDINNRGQQLEELILKNDLILFKDKRHTYFHSASGTFTSIDLTLCSPSVMTLVEVTTFPSCWKRWTYLSGKGKLWSIPASMQHSSAPICHCRRWWSHAFVHFHLEGHCRRNYF